MKDYNYENKWEQLITPEIVSLLTQIHEFKGEQKLFVEQKADTLTTLLEIAKIQSTEASNKIEGIYTSDDRVKLLVMDKTTPQSRDEQEIAGYRDVLATIHESHDFIPIKPSMILQLHRDLYKYSGLNFGGKYKNSDNVIAEKMTDGTQKVRFQPVHSWETAESVEELCNAYNQIMGTGKANALLLIPMFVLDFLCIHPFNDGNGRMSRLMTLLLLYRTNCIVGKYISIEKIIEQSKETYYETLQVSSYGWHEDENDYAPFVRYMLGVIIAAYREFENRVEVMITKGYSKPERIAETIKQTLGQVTKRELMEKCPDISDTTIQRALNDLVKQNRIIKMSGGRYTKYIWNRELGD
ncbi:Fic family protein [Tannockella kyphosi]|uniref:Fic family protein n=1 Tax=Tannockella kyphosi TaxID=2899121 RepID=UPI002011E29E|nr:Fic family protein [Tannockella kyphosi]